MGGCASRPKDADFKSEDVPEAPVSPTKAEGDAAIAPENNTDGDESEKIEEPLVDVSEVKEEKQSEAAEPQEPAKDEDEPLVTV